MNLLIQNGRIIDPSQKLDEKGDLLIENGVVTAIGRDLKAPDGVARIDAHGLVVAPGFIDLHTHLREPGQEHKETILTGTRAAVRGGYTAVCAMANTVPPNDERAVTEMIVAEAARNGQCRVYPIGAVSRGLKGEEMAELADLRAAGCVGVSDDGKPISNAKLMRRALEYTKMLGIPVIAHEQDPDLSEGCAMHEGYYSTILGLRGAPAAAEEVMTARDVILAQLTGGHLHVAHLSTRGAIDAVRRAKKAGVRVTCEVTPHHLALSDEALQSFSTNLKMNPPLRSDDHREAIFEAIADGTIDAIATDHAPHHVDEKNVEFDLAPFGVIGLETAFAVCCDLLVHRRKLVDLKTLIDLFSCRPARVFSLPGGTLRKGSAADVTIVDPNATWEAKDYASRSSNSPFTGSQYRGRVVATVVGGVVRYLDSEALRSGKAGPAAAAPRAASKAAAARKRR
jgi:dihydroorotase